MAWDVPNGLLWGYLVTTSLVSGALVYLGTVARNLFELPGSTDRVAAMMRRVPPILVLEAIALGLGVAVILARSWQDPSSWVVVAAIALNLARPAPILALMGGRAAARIVRARAPDADALSKARQAFVHGAPFSAALSLVALALTSALPFILP